MAIARWTLLGVLILAAATLLLDRAGVISLRAESVVAGSYTCPMHPQYTSNAPGECPICGMSLVPRADMHAEHDTSAVAQHENAHVPGLVPLTLPSDRIQRIGLRTAAAEYRVLGDELRVVGFVAPDESRLTRVQVRASGWVRRLYVTETGARVAQGQPIVSLYSPAMYQAEQEYALAARSADAHDGALAQQARHRLELLGIPSAEIARVARTGTPSEEITLASPAHGYVLEKNVLDGQFIDANTPLFTLADLSRVWVLGDVYERDLSRVRVGQSVQLRVSAEPGRDFTGRVDYIYPTVSMATRTLKIRVVFDNPNMRLLPGMYGDMRVATRSDSVLAVPHEAVVQTGEFSYVFLAYPGGRFEPRLVRTGVQDAGFIEVLDGLANGQRVVTSANFLIDSESRLRASAEGETAPRAHEGHGRP